MIPLLGRFPEEGIGYPLQYSGLENAMDYHPWGHKELGTTEGLGFPSSSAGKESACNAGDPGSIPGSGRSTGEGIGYPFQYF